MPVVRIDHVQLAMPVGREDEATAFYEGLLGLVRVPKPDPLAARGGCWFEGDDGPDPPRSDSNRLPFVPVDRAA